MALTARDKGCIIPSCPRPANQCDAHHITPWAQGGLINIDQLALLCTPHHNAVHAGHHHIISKDGTPWIRTHPHPAGPDRAPALRRNTLHHDANHARNLGEQLRLNTTPAPPEPEPPPPEPPAPEPAPRKPPDLGPPRPHLGV